MPITIGNGRPTFSATKRENEVIIFKKSCFLFQKYLKRACSWRLNSQFFFFFFFDPHCYVLRIWPLGTNPIKHAEKGRGQLAYWVRDLKLGGGCLYPYSFH